MATDRASLSKVVSEKIRGQILAGRLKPGERLIEDRLSAELGVSRVPVREALRGLSMEGLVRLEPNRGASVTEVTPQLLAELVEVRTLLEALRQESTDGVLRTTSISPGFVSTELVDYLDDPEVRQQAQSRMQTLGIEPGAVARAVAFAIEQPDDVEIGDITVRPTRQN